MGFYLHGRDRYGGWYILFLKNSIFMTMIQRFFGLFLFSIPVFLLSAQSLWAQNSVLSGGGESASSASGSLSVSFGEVFTDYFESSGSIIGKSGVQHNFEWLYPWMRIKASLKYKNTLNSPLSMVQINLRDHNGSIIANGVTNTQGVAEMGFVKDGVYSIEYTDNRSWGGANGTDALLINRSFTGFNLLNGLYAQAGDINQNLVLTNSDALMVMRRVAGYTSTFPSGDWAYSVNQVQVQRQPGQRDSLMLGEALFAGDVNGSYSPGIINRTAWQTLSNSGKMTPLNENFEWVISAGQNMKLGAATLLLQIPSGLTVNKIWCKQNSNNQQLVFRQEGNLIRLVWFSLDEWVVSQGDDLFVMNVNGMSEGSMLVDMGQSELADPLGNPMNLWKLSTHDLASPKQTTWSALLTPNPVEDHTMINLLMHASGVLELKVIDPMGRVLAHDELTLLKGSHLIPFKYADILNTGHYTLQLLYKCFDPKMGFSEEIKHIKFSKK